jgi:hypothetical protein
MISRLRSACLILLACATLLSCGVCGAVLCISSFELDLNAPFSPEAAQAATYTVCRNTNCTTSTLNAADGGAPTVLPSGSGPVRYVQGSTTSWLEIHYFWVPPDQPRDGDVYRVTVVSAQGQTLIDVTRQVTYTPFNPNGCGQDCYQAKVDLRSPGA